MIRYSKKYWGLATLLRWYGSAFPRGVVFSAFAVVLAGVLEAFWDQTGADQWRHPYPYQAFAFIVGFMIVFRSNLGYGRYWEGRGHLVTMTSKLTDAVVQAITFDKLTLPKEPTEEQVMEHERFRDNFIHLCSLLHAVALATLRDDFNMENLVEHDSDCAAPAANFMALHRDGRDLEDIAEVPELSRQGSSNEGSKGEHSGVRAAAAAAAAAASRGTAAASSPQAKPSTDSTHPERSRKSKELAFRASAGLQSWLDTFMLRTGAERSALIYTHMKLPVIGGLTQAEGTALGGFATLGVEHAVPDFDVAVHGCTLDNGALPAAGPSTARVSAGLYTPAPTERVHTVLAWVQQCLLERIQAGGVAVDPPIKSRIHQVLSDTMLGYEQARKLSDTQFPFPWAQAITIVLTLFCITAPFLISAYTETVPTAMIVTFCAVHTYFMLNEVARDIEDPFHYDPNELPLPQLQYKLNERFFAVARTTRPLAFTDITALDGPGNRPDMNSDDIERYLSSHPTEGTQSFTAAVSGRTSDVASAVEAHLNRRTAGSARRSASGAALGDGHQASRSLDAGSPRPGGRPASGRLASALAPFSANDATTLALAGRVKQKAVRWRANAGAISRRASGAGARRSDVRRSAARMSHDATTDTPRHSAANDSVRIHIDGLQANSRVHGTGPASMQFQADSDQGKSRLDTPFDASEQQHEMEANSGPAGSGGADWPSKEFYDGVQR